MNCKNYINKHFANIILEMLGKSIISARDFSREEFLQVIELAGRFRKTRTGYVGTGVHFSKLLKGKRVALLFYEPSTRTIFSFKAAAESLGAWTSYIDYKSSYYGREGMLEWDIDLCIALKSDAIVLRSPEDFSAECAACSVKSLSDLVGSPIVPVINAGDGKNEHPTQALTDLYTIMDEKGKIDGLRIGIFGDLRYGRTVHSLAYALSKFDVKVYFASDDALRMPRERLKELDSLGLKCEEASISELQKLIRHLDVGYATRIQKERFSSPEEYEKAKNMYVIDNEMMQHAGKDFLLLHPLPRVSEIAPEVDSDSRAAYFRQAANSLPVRQALLSLVLGTKN